MAHKAAALINDVNYNANGVTYDVKVMDGQSPSHSQQMSHGPVAIDTLDVTVNADIRAAAQTFAENEFGTTFGMLDTVKLINPVSS